MRRIMLATATLVLVAGCSGVSDSTAAPTMVSLLQVVGAVVILGLVVLLFMNLGKIW